MRPFVSIIVPAFNEEAMLAACLESLRALAYPPERREVIVVDNGSVDRTLEIAKGAADQALSYPGSPVSKVRNFGVSRSKGEILAFLDADCTVPSGWLDAAVETMGGRDCIVGAAHRNPPDAPWIARAWFTKTFAGIREVHSLSCGNLILSRALFQKLGGFDETLTTGEDTELCARALKLAPIIENPEIIAFHHGIPRTLRQFFRREIWHGLGAFGTFRVNWFDPPLLGTVTFLVLHVLGVIGLVSLAAGGGASMLAAAVLKVAVLGVAMLLAGTLVYRRKNLRSFIHGAQLFLLYYLYYAARSLSLFLLLSRRSFYHNNKQAVRAVKEVSETGS